MFADLFGKLLAGTKTSYIPAAVFAAAFFYFCSALNFAPEQNVMWYVLFYVFCGINAAFLSFFAANQNNIYNNLAPHCRYNP